MYEDSEIALKKFGLQILQRDHDRALSDKILTDNNLTWRNVTYNSEMYPEWRYSTYTWGGGPGIKYEFKIRKGKGNYKSDCEIEDPEGLGWLMSEILKIEITDEDRK